MNKILLSVLVLFTLRANSQVKLKIRQIDSLVQLINQSNFKVQNDSIDDERPELGLTMKTYLTMIVDGNELKKYVHDAYTTRIEKGISVQIFTSLVFYYNKNKLIKAEDFAKEGDKKQNVEWYYWNDKPIYYTDQSPKAVYRADFLLKVSNVFLKQALK